jgi:hypothetical protein
MTTIRKALTAGMNPDRIACAAHEIGHAVAIHHAGIPIRRIRIQPARPDGWTGDCAPAVKQIPAQQLPGWQVGLMAGEAAIYRFLLTYATHTRREARTMAETSARHDLADFRRLRVKGGLTLAEARAQATALVERHSARIDQLTIRLATSQHLSGSVL